MKGKRTPKKNLKHDQKSMLKSNFTETDDEEKADVSKSKSTPAKKIQKMSSGIVN